MDMTGFSCDLEAKLILGGLEAVSIAVAHIAADQKPRVQTPSSFHHIHQLRGRRVHSKAQS